MNSSQSSISPLQQSAAFELTFRVRQPQPAKPKVSVVLLHGVGGSETNLADVATAINPDTLVVLPRGPLQFSPGQFLRFFRVSH